MKISKTLSVLNIKEQFNGQFPFLNIEFYNYEHEKHEGSSVDAQINQDTLLSVINPQLDETVENINPEMTVAEFETMMKERFNFNVQVFRKSNEIWLQTSSTDNWTLDKQNGKGERSTVDYGIEPVNISDFDLD